MPDFSLQQGGYLIYIWKVKAQDKRDRYTKKAGKRTIKHFKHKVPLLESQYIWNLDFISWLRKELLFIIYIINQIVHV